jgi:hypothetical protein
MASARVDWRNLQQVEVLEDQPDVAARRAQLGVGQGGELAPADDHLARLGPVQQVDGAHQRALAGAAAADDAEDLAGRNVQVHAAQCLVRAIGLGDALQLNHAGVSFVRTRPRRPPVQGRLEVQGSGGMPGAGAA